MFKKTYVKEAIELLKDSCPATKKLDNKTWKKVSGSILKSLTASSDISKQDFTADIRVMLGCQGDSESETDICSYRALWQIYDFISIYCSSKNRFRENQKEDKEVMSFYPAQELRYITPDEPDWEKRWLSLGGKLYENNRMIALRSDPIWKKLSDFNLPHPPFSFGSTVDIEDIDLPEAEKLGLL